MSRGNIWHAFHVGVRTGIFEEFRNFRGVQLRAGQVRAVAAAFAVGAVAFVTFVGEKAGFALGDQGVALLRPRFRLRDAVRNLGQTVVMVTHERALAERYARRMIVLADGKLIDDRPNVPAAASSETSGAQR